MPKRELMTWQAATHQVRKAKKPRKKSGVSTDLRAVKVADRWATVTWMSSSMSSTPSSSSSGVLGNTGAAVGITSAGVTPGVSSAPIPQEKSPGRNQRIFMFYQILERGRVKEGRPWRYSWHWSLTFTVDVSNVQVHCSCRHPNLSLQE